VILVNCESVN